MTQPKKTIWCKPNLPLFLNRNSAVGRRLIAAKPIPARPCKVGKTGVKSSHAPEWVGGAQSVLAAAKLVGSFGAQFGAVARDSLI